MIRTLSALLVGRLGRFTRRAVRPSGYPVEYEHPTQGIASAFLRAIAEDDADAMWERLSRESRGLLEGRYAARAGVPLHSAAGAGGSDGDARVREIVAPLRASALAALGGSDRVNGFGVSAARVVDRRTAYVLLLADFGVERIVAEDEWRPSHLLAFVHESGAAPGGSGVPPGGSRVPPGGSAEWLVDLGRTASLSSEAQLPDPLGAIS